MTHVVSQETYIDNNKLYEIYQDLKLLDINEIQPFLYDIAREDNAYGDLTEMHPKDRKEVSSHAALLFGGDVNPQLKSILGDTYNKIENLSGIELATFFFIAPNSIVPTHIHDMERPEYDYTSHYNVFLNISVPSDDSNIVGAKIGNDIYNNKDGQALIFDYQVPHSAWNKTDKWWLGIIFYINKESFNESIDT